MASGQKQKLLVPLALSGFLLFNLLFILSLLNSPNFVLFTNYLSDLGAGPSSLYFNSGCILAGTLLFAVFALLLRESKAIKFSGIGCAIGMLSSLALIGVGLFPETTGLHGAVSAAYFLLSGLSVLSYTLSYGAYIGFANRLALLGALHFIFTILLAAAIFSGTKSAPRYETLTVFAFQLWVLAAAFANKRKSKGDS